MSSDQLGRLKEALAGRYQFERELGEGAFATVFLARDLRLERLVAIKVLHIEPSSDVNETRFLREIRFLAGLQHPNIVPVHDSGHLENLLYYVMPYVRGESLRERIRRERQLAVADAVRIACEISDALECAHNTGIIHRDIKPENILLSASHPMLADFGVARAINMSRGPKITKPGFGSPGTPAYMSPEQMIGERELDKRTDIYSLGCVLYEMLTGHAPFEGASGFVKRFTEQPPSARAKRPEVSQILDRALTQALGRTPEERFQSAAQMGTALSHSPELAAENSGNLDSDKAPAIDPSDVGPPSSRIRGWTTSPKLRRRAALGVIGAVIVILGARPAIGYFGHSSADETLLDPRRIAVLDFEDQSPDHSLGHIASGLSVSLTHELSGVSALQVLSRNSVKSFRDRGVSLDSIVRVLHVGSLIEGSVQRSNDKLRLTVQMENAQSNTQLESATIERGMGDLFMLEDDLAHQVALLLRRRLGVEFRVRATIIGTKSARARDLVFQADKLREDAEADASSSDSSDFAHAQVRLHSADSLLAAAESADPRWIAPIIERGWIELSIARGPTDTSRAQHFRRAAELATRALLRDPANAAALELRGTTMYWQVVRLDMPDSQFNDLLARAEPDLKRAVALDSSLATAWGTLSLVRFARGDVSEAARAARTALAMDTYLKDAPSILQALYDADLMKGATTEAWQWCKLGARDYPRDSRFIECQLTLLAEDSARRPDPREAWSLVGKANEIDPPAHTRATGRPYLPTYRQMMAAMVLARAGQRDSAQSVARRARAAIASDTTLRSDFLYDEAYLHLLLGEHSETLRLLSEYLAMRPSLRSLVSRHPRWRPLWNDSAFVALTGIASPSKQSKQSQGR